MFDKLFNDMPGNSGMPFPFPMNSVVSTVVQAPAANDAHRIDWTGEEPIPAGHFDFERGEGFAIFSSKRGGRETENSAEFDILPSVNGGDSYSSQAHDCTRVASVGS
jgi:hypothetical protein